MIMRNKSNISLATEIIKTEITALTRTLKRIDSSFDRACELIKKNSGKVVTIGLGKSGYIAMKMAATLSSTGTAALFLHPVDALHGDVGVIKKNDVVIIYSNSGETQEVVKLLPLLKLLKCYIVSITGNLSSSLAQYSNISLDASVTREACPHNLAPTSSIICALALSDALALAISLQNNFSIKDFAKTHPGGAIGKRLMVTVSNIMIKRKKRHIILKYLPIGSVRGFNILPILPPTFPPRAPPAAPSNIPPTGPPIALPNIAPPVAPSPAPVVAPSVSGSKPSPDIIDPTIPTPKPSPAPSPNFANLLR